MFPLTKQNKSVVNLMFAVHSGDVSALRRYGVKALLFMCFFEIRLACLTESLRVTWHSSVQVRTVINEHGASRLRLSHATPCGSCSRWVPGHSVMNMYKLCPLVVEWLSCHSSSAEHSRWCIQVTWKLCCFWQRCAKSTLLWRIGKNPFSPFAFLSLFFSFRPSVSSSMSVIFCLQSTHVSSISCFSKNTHPSPIFYSVLGGGTFRWMMPCILATSVWWRFSSSTSMSTASKNLRPRWRIRKSLRLWRG